MKGPGHCQEEEMQAYLLHILALVVCRFVSIVKLNISSIAWKRARCQSFAMETDFNSSNLTLHPSSDDVDLFRVT